MVPLIPVFAAAFLGTAACNVASKVASAAGSSIRRRLAKRASARLEREVDVALASVQPVAVA